MHNMYIDWSHIVNSRNLFSWKMEGPWFCTHSLHTRHRIQGRVKEIHELHKGPLNVNVCYLRLVSYCIFSTAKFVEVIQEFPMHSSPKQHCHAGFSFYETPGIFFPWHLLCRSTDNEHVFRNDSPMTVVITIVLIRITQCCSQQRRRYRRSFGVHVLALPGAGCNHQPSPQYRSQRVLEVAAALMSPFYDFSSACVLPWYGSPQCFVKICQWSRVLVMVGDIRFG